MSPGGSLFLPYYLRGREADNITRFLHSIDETDGVFLPSFLRQVAPLREYLNTNFYNRTDGDERYDLTADTILGSRIDSGINAGNISTGTLHAARVANNYLPASDFSGTMEVPNTIGTATKISMSFRDGGDQVYDRTINLIVDIDVQYFTGQDGSTGKGFSGRFIHLVEGYPLFVGVNSDGTRLFNGSTDPGLANDMIISAPSGETPISYPTTAVSPWSFNIRRVYSSFGGEIGRIKVILSTATDQVVADFDLIPSRV